MPGFWQARIRRPTRRSRRRRRWKPTRILPRRTSCGDNCYCQGDSQAGVRELQLALRLKPDSGRAHYELGVALGRLGNSAAAAEHLKMAAQGTDPDAKAAALEMLRRIGR